MAGRIILLTAGTGGLILIVPFFKITKSYTYEQVNQFLLVGLFLRLPLKMTCT
ncbi:hypothetical protein [Peribacillus aracenensis]|uniref:hypothetical protein n=1 Tax=Peribacillus aracenensis TaxID=2976708 RepID=UPI0021A4E4CA|nr:hypothetical protein [Peribacillus sp. BBB004]